MKNTNGDVLILVKINTPPWVFFTLFKLYKCYQIAQHITCYHSLPMRRFQGYWKGTVVRSMRHEVFCKKVLLKISQNSQENTCVGVSYNFFKKEVKFLRSPFFIEHLWRLPLTGLKLDQWTYPILYLFMAYTNHFIFRFLQK